MPYAIVKGDITKMKVGAVVCPTDELMSGGGGADLALHLAAGPKLRRACDAIGRCSAESPAVTRAYRLPSEYIVHTVGPIWRGGGEGEAEALEACAVRALEVAAGLGCASAALPLISSGTFGFPKPISLAALSAAAKRSLAVHDMDIYLVVYDRDDFAIDDLLLNRLRGFIDEHFDDLDDEEQLFEICACPMPSLPKPSKKRKARRDEIESYRDIAPMMPCSLADEVSSIEMGFSEMLLRKIDERGMTDVECYKRANVDRRLFSKIRSNRYHSPSKDTVLSFAIALSLSIDETRDLLERAGFALSRSSKRDVIVEYFIREGRCDIFAINEALFAFDQKPLSV